MDTCLLYTAGSVNLSSCHCCSPSCFLPVLVFFYCLSFIPMYLAAVAFPSKVIPHRPRDLNGKEAGHRCCFDVHTPHLCCWLWKLLMSVNSSNAVVSVSTKMVTMTSFIFSNQSQASHSSHTYTVYKFYVTIIPTIVIHPLPCHWCFLYTILCRILSYPFMFIPLIYLFFRLSSYSLVKTGFVTTWYTSTVYSHGWVLSPIIYILFCTGEPWVSKCQEFGNTGLQVSSRKGMTNLNILTEQYSNRILFIVTECSPRNKWLATRHVTLGSVLDRKKVEYCLAFQGSIKREAWTGWMIWDSGQLAILPGNASYPTRS